MTAPGGSGRSHARILPVGQRPLLPVTRSSVIPKPEIIQTQLVGKNGHWSLGCFQAATHGNRRSSGCVAAIWTNCTCRWSRAVGSG